MWFIVSDNKLWLVKKFKKNMTKYDTCGTHESIVCLINKNNTNKNWKLFCSIDRMMIKKRIEKMRTFLLPFVQIINKNRFFVQSQLKTMINEWMMMTSEKKDNYYRKAGMSMNWFDDENIKCFFLLKNWKYNHQIKWWQ